MAFRAVFTNSAVAAALTLAALPVLQPAGVASAAGDQCAELLRGWNAALPLTNRRQSIVDRNRSGESEAAHQAALRQISNLLQQEAQIWHNMAGRLDSPELSDPAEGVAEQFDEAAGDPTLVDDKLGGDSFSQVFFPFADAARDLCPVAWNQMSH